MWDRRVPRSVMSHLALGEEEIARWRVSVGSAALSLSCRAGDIAGSGLLFASLLIVVCPGFISVCSVAVDLKCDRWSRRKRRMWIVSGRARV